MTDRTKIERVGGHLIVGGYAVPIATVEIGMHCGALCVFSRREAHTVYGWTRQEILEVAYGPKGSPEWWEPSTRPQVDTEKTIADLRATVKVHRDGITAARKEIEDLRAGLAARYKAEENLHVELDRKDEEIAVLREALRRVLGHYFAEARNGDGIGESAWTDVAAAMTLAKADGPRFDEPAIEYGLASIHEAAKVGR